jgi:hypothetical protein
LTWVQIIQANAVPPANDMAVLNADMLWLVSGIGLEGGIFMSTNGGINWITQYNTLSDNPTKIYMYNLRIGFACTGNLMLKTTNSGQNWNQIGGSSSNIPFNDMFFIDSLRGWKTYDSVRYTSNGGINWITQTLPFGGIITTSGISRFSKNNPDTIWGVGGQVYYGGGSPIRGILYRTTNGGINWFFQVPDTSFHFFRYSLIDFENRNGWAYGFHNGSGMGGIHTLTGGDSIFYTGIRKISSSIPLKSKMFQNYPNPFNPRTVISYQLRYSGHIKLSVYDLTGKLVVNLINQKQSAGIYDVDFSGIGYSSGIYFYRMTVTDDKTKQMFTETKTMVLLK